MGIVVITSKVTPKDIDVASEEYGSYIKVVADIENEIVAIGGQWHADAEKVLLEYGSKQSNLWGGGIETKTRTIETTALINLRPKQGNSSQDILDATARKKFIKIVSDKFEI